MQPPPPRKLAPRTTLGDTTHTRAAPTRHPQGPPDFAAPEDGSSKPLVSGTRDHALIRAWAAHHGAEPATGEATSTGPAVIDVNDQGAGVRFNFPAAARFRPVDWDEWFALFERDGLIFVFETRGEDDDTALNRFGGAFYRLIAATEWGDRPLCALDDHDAGR